MNYFRLIPSWVWVAIALIAAGLWYGHTRYNAGEAHTQAKWDKSTAKGKIELERLRVAAAKVTIKTETVYVDRIKTIREKGDEVVRKIPVYIPVDSPDLAGGWRLFHEAAIGKDPVPLSTSVTDAASVPAFVFASTVNANYQSAQETAARLIGLQDWVLEQCKVNPPKEGCGE